MLPLNAFSQNHTIFRDIGRDLCISSSPTTPRAHCTGTCPGGCWISPKKETPWTPWAAYRSYYKNIQTKKVVCKLSRKCLNIYYELVVLGNSAGETTQKNENQAGWTSDQTKAKTLDNRNCFTWNLKEKKYGLLKEKQMVCMALKFFSLHYSY